MSTRATYKIKPLNDWDTGATFYIHYDGYPEGAAHYFLNALKELRKNISKKANTYRNKSGGWAEAFIRGNDSAQFTENHETHGDTEYKYTLDPKTMKLKIEQRVEYGEHWHAYTMPLDEFININEKWSEEKEKVFPVQFSTCTKNTELHTVSTIEPIIKAKLSTLKMWADKGLGGANFDNLKKEIDLIMESVMKNDEFFK